MPGVIELIYSPNPLRPLDRVRRAVLATGSDTVDSLVRRMGLHATPLAVSVNGRNAPRRRWHKRRVRHGDIVVMHQGAAGFEAGAVAVKAGVSYFWGAVIAISLNAAIAYVVSAIANSLAPQPKQGGSSAQKGADAFSVEGGSNQMRPYQPLPLVLGEHRIFPDYAARPFSEFVPDPTNVIETIDSTPATEMRTHLPFALDAGEPTAPWVLIASDEVWRYYGDSQPRQFRSPGGEVNRPHTFVVRVPLDGGAGQVTTYEDYITPPADTGGGVDGGGGEGGGEGGLGGSDSGTGTNGSAGDGFGGSSSGESGFA